jgi:predicted RNase H-like nuclease (RuvC/YqgF family)
MFDCLEPSPQQKTLLVSIISLLSSNGLNTVDKNAFARALVLAGQTVNAEIAFEDQEAAEQEKAKEEMARLEKQITQLTKELEHLKKHLR